jgi:hypothetical protein
MSEIEHPNEWSEYASLDRATIAAEGDDMPQYYLAIWTKLQGVMRGKYNLITNAETCLRGSGKLLED